MMMTKSRGAVAALAAMALLTGCSQSLMGPPKAQLSIDLKAGAYVAIYADSLTREAGISTVSASGALVASQQISALGLEKRTNSDQAIALAGERAADMVIVKKDGTVSASAIDFPDGTGVTATAWVSDSELASLVNVGTSADGYKNPLVLHTTAGTVNYSLPLSGYLTTLVVTPRELVMAGQIGKAGAPEDGSRVIRVDRESKKVVATFDWPDRGGLTGCVVQRRTLWCLESAPFDDGNRTLEQNLVVSIDLDSGKKTQHAQLAEMGVGLTQASGRLLVIGKTSLGALDDVLAKKPMLALGGGQKSIEQVVGAGGFIDVFVRDYDRTITSDGRADIGRVVRLDAKTLKVVRQTPLQLPNQQLVGVHLIAHEFFQD